MKNNTTKAPSYIGVDGFPQEDSIGCLAVIVVLVMIGFATWGIIELVAKAF